MKILEKQVYLGPNLYANFPVMRLLVDLEELEEWPSARLGDAFIEPLLEALPGLREHGCSYGEPGGFVRRLREDEGTWMGHILEHVALELQNTAGGQVSFGRTRSTGEAGHYNVVYQYAQREVGREAGELAFRLLNGLLPEELRSADHPKDFDFEEERDELIRFTQRRALGPSTASLVRAADERDIPWVRLNQYSLVQLGFGKNQRRIQATITSETRHIAVGSERTFSSSGVSTEAAGRHRLRDSGRWIARGWGHATALFAQSGTQTGKSRGCRHRITPVSREEVPLARTRRRRLFHPQCDSLYRGRQATVRVYGALQGRATQVVQQVLPPRRTCRKHLRPLRRRRIRPVEARVKGGKHTVPRAADRSTPCAGGDEARTAAAPA